MKGQPSLTLSLALALALGGCGGSPASDDPGPGAPDALDATDVADPTDAADVPVGTWPAGIEPAPADDPAIPAAGGLPAETAWDASDRPRLDLSGSWRFRFDDDGVGEAEGWQLPDADRKSWESHPVPGTWDLHAEGGFGRRTVGWYAREFEGPPDAGDLVRLRFEGAFRAAKVWLNGTLLGEDDLPYLPFAFDATDALRPGRNVLIVRVDGRIDRHTLPVDTASSPGKHGWWPYGGLTRPVTLEGSPAVSLQRCRIRTRPDGTVDARVDLVARPDAPAATLRARLLAPDGTPAHQWDDAALPAGFAGGLRLTATVPAPTRWTREAPAAYRLELGVTAGGRTETVACDAGFRTFEARDERFFLDGKDTYLHGVNRHEDHPDLGPVFDETLMATDVGLMRQMGVDFCRPGHYPNDVRVLRALEAAGILVVEEVPVYQWDGEPMEDPVAVDRARRAVQRMVVRDANRPGIVMWSVANEIWTFDPRAEGFVRTLADAARALDPDRPVFIAMNQEILSFSEIDTGAAAADVVGVNEYWGWYQGATTGLGAYLDLARARWPGKTIFLSEYGADTLRGRHAVAPPGEEPSDDHSFSEEFQAWFHRQHLRAAAERDFVRGVMPWVFADFRMEWTPSTGRPFPRRNANLKGLVDGWRKPKAVFETYRAAFAAPGGLAVPAEPECGDGRVEAREACDGGKRPCTDLGSSWTAGEAPCRADCAGWDVAACAGVAADGRWEVVKPALRDPARWAHAVCNDGTPFWFRVRPSPTGSRDWVIGLRGGGFCDDAAVPCLRTADLSGTTPDADFARVVPEGDDRGVHAPEPAINPDFHDANHVFAMYCSSDFWAGTLTEPRPISTTEGPGWVFAGRNNVAAMLDTLTARYGLADGPEVRVLFTGESSGGMGAATNVDALAERLPDAAAAGRVRLAVDAGWLVHDWDDPTMRVLLADAADADVIDRAWEFLGLQFHSGCERERTRAPGGRPSDCLFGYRWFPAVAAPSAGTALPVFVHQSLQDMTFVGYHNRPDDVAAATRYGDRQEAEMREVDPDDGLKGAWFLGRSPYHGVIFDDGAMAKGTAGNTIREVLSRFWNGGAPERVVWEPLQGAPGAL